MSLMRTTAVVALLATALSACAHAGAPRVAGLQKPATYQAKGALPKSFMWGVSTAGYQWEGQDTTSQWAAFDKAGKTAERNTRGADGLVRWEEDLDLTKGMGCNAFRTSIEWARIEPTEGHYDKAAIAHYHRLLDGMRARGLEPVVTLQHFAHPEWLSAEGGWESAQAPEKFARYAAFIAKEFGSKITWYITFNEPNIQLLGGWLASMMPPGKTDPIAGARALRRMAKGHGLAYDAIHANDPDAQVSFNMYTAEWALGAPAKPLTAAQTRDPRAVAEHELTSETFFLDEVNKNGRKLDYAALDYYCKFRLYLPFKFPQADTWEVYPEGIYNAVKRYNKRYNLPVLIAENGMATFDLKPRADRWSRSAYLVSHVAQVQRAVDEGIPVLGYIHWSITDNYEWGSFSPRFGLFSVDCRNGDFTRKAADGAQAFQDVIGRKGVTNDIARRYPVPASIQAPTGGPGLPVSTY